MCLPIDLLFTSQKPAGLEPASGVRQPMLTIALGGNNDAPTEAEVELTTDEVFHLLSNSRRRAILLTLMDHGPLPKRELSERVAEREHGVDRSELTSDDKQSVRVSLHQNHVPRLEDSDVINVEHNTISLGPNATELAKHLENDSLVRRLLPF